MCRLIPCNLACTLAVLLTIGGCLGIGATSFGEEVAEPLTAPQVLDRMRKSLAAISSISYEFKNDQKTSQTTGAFAWSEKRFYSTFISERRPGTVVMHEHVAFDGEFHQRFSARLTELSVSAKPFVAGKNPYMAQQPLLIPFFFVRLDQEKSRIGTLELLQSAEYWKDIAARAKLKASRMVDGHDCDVVEFSQPADIDTLDWEICAARDLDYYPIDQAMRSREGTKETRSTIRMKSFADVTTTSGRVIVPLEIATEARNAAGEVIASYLYKIDKNSLKVNEPVGLETFDLKRLQPLKTRFIAGVTDEQRRRFESGGK